VTIEGTLTARDDVIGGGKSLKGTRMAACNPARPTPPRRIERLPIRVNRASCRLSSGNSRALAMFVTNHHHLTTVAPHLKAPGLLYQRYQLMAQPAVRGSNSGPVPAAAKPSRKMNQPSLVSACAIARNINAAACDGVLDGEGGGETAFTSSNCRCLRWI
jgi:hypothetical protein